MKRNFNLLSILLVLISLISFSSCESEIDELIPAPTVTLNDIVGEGFVGQAITISAKVDAGAKLSSIILRLNNDELINKTKNFESKTSDIFSFDYVIKKADLETTLSFSLIATDKGDRTTKTDFTFDAIPAITITLGETPEKASVGQTITVIGSVKSGADLKSIDLKLGDTVLESKTEGLSNDFSFEYVVKAEDFDTDKMLNLSVVATDINKRTSMVEFALARTSLSAEEAFTFKRVGTNSEGLAQFGLLWTSNSSKFAIIKKGAENKLVKLTAADFTSITTKDALKAKVDEMDGIEKFEEVSSEKGADYDFVLATKKGDEYFLLNIKKATVVTDATVGTTITITGVYKM